MYITTLLWHLSIGFRKFMRKFARNFEDAKKGAESFFSAAQTRQGNVRTETKTSGEHDVFRDRMNFTHSVVIKEKLLLLLIRERPAKASPDFFDLFQCFVHFRRINTHLRANITIP